MGDHRATQKDGIWKVGRECIDLSEEKTKSLEERFPSNNYTQIKPREEIVKKDDKQLTDGKAKKKIHAKEQKRTFGERIADNFLNMDHEQIRDRLLFDWLFPEIIATIDDVLRMIFFGDRNGGGRRRRDRDSRGYTSYNSIYDERRRDRDRDMPDPTRQNFRRIRLEFGDREDADDLLDQIREALEESDSGWVTVKELYSLAELPTNSTMYKWGWTDLEDCMVTRKGDIYVLEMPRAEVIR
jgi:hypothetical protein